MAKELMLDIDEFLKTVYWTRQAEWRRKQSEANKRFYAKRRAERHRKAVESLERAADARMAAKGKRTPIERARAFRDGFDDGKGRMRELLAAMTPGTWYRITDLRDACPGMGFNPLRGRVAEAVKRGLLEMKCYCAAGPSGRAKFVYCLTAEGEASRAGSGVSQ